MSSFGERFGRLVQVRRGVEGLTQEELAAQAFGCGSRKSRISELENGRVAKPQQKSIDAIAIALVIDPKEVEALYEDTQEPTHGPEMSSHWTDMLQALVRLQDAMGQRNLFDIVRGELSIIQQHRMRVATRETTPGLLSVESRWAEFASWIAANLCRQGEERFWLRISHSLSEAAADKPLIAYNLMRQAQTAIEDGSADIGLNLARKAMTCTRLSNTDKALCWLREAQGYAILGDRKGSSAAVDTAFRCLEQPYLMSVDDNQNAIGSHCTIPYALAHQGYCLLHLGDLQSASRIIEQALEDWPARFVQDEGLARAWLAVIHSSRRDIETAAAEGQLALDIASTSHSNRILKVLGKAVFNIKSHYQDVPDNVSHFCRSVDITRRHQAQEHDTNRDN